MAHDEPRHHSDDGQSEPAASAMGSRREVSLRRAFLTGMAALLPTALTVALLAWGFSLIYSYVAEPINNFIIWIMSLIEGGNWNLAEATFRHREHDGEVRGWFDLSFAGFVIAVSGVFFVGLVLLTIVGRRLYRVVDRALARLPVLKLVYPHLKQLTEFIFDERKAAKFRRVVVIEYPRKGLWSVGFVTGPGIRAVHKAAGQDMVTVFIPSSPTPFTGYVVALPPEDVVDVPISVDEALRFTVSGGVLVPPRQQPNLRKDSEAREIVSPQQAPDPGDER